MARNWFVVALPIAALGCAQLSGLGDFTDEGAAGGASATSGGGGAVGGGSTGGGGTGAMMSSTTSGGGGAMDPCAPGALNDDDNCGACNHSCDGGTCTEGICSPVEFDFGQELGALAVLGNEVVFVRGNQLAALNVDADSTAQASPVPNSTFGLPSNRNAVLSAGASHVFLAPQAMESALAVLYTCHPTNGCVNHTYDVQGAHFNAVVLDGNRLLILSSNPDNKLYELGLDPFEVPTGGLVDWATGGFEELAYEGLHQAYRDGSHLVVSTFSDTQNDACVYRVDLGVKPSNAIPCMGIFRDNIRGSFAGDGRIFAYTLAQVYAIAPTGMNPAIDWANGRGPIGAGAKDVYVGAVGGGLSVFANDASEIAMFPGNNLSGIDASHPKYVFYTSDYSLFRWRKRVLDP